MTNADHLDDIDRDVVYAVLRIRRNHNAAQRRLKLPVIDHGGRSPFEMEDASGD